MSNESEPGRVTQLFEPALAGDREAQDELFRLIEPVARQLAFRWLRTYSAQDRVRVTELIDEAFLRLVPAPGAAGGGRPFPWPHRGAFYAYLCRVMMQTLVDVFRRQHKASNSTAIPDILADAIDGSEAVRQRLVETGGDLGEVGRVLSDVIWADPTAPRILGAGGDPSAVQRAVEKLLRRKVSRPLLHETGGNAATIDQRVLELIRSEPARRLLVVYKSVSENPAGLDRF